jgi:hypothetical protein
MDSILDDAWDAATAPTQASIHRGATRGRHTVSGWKLKVRWTDSSTAWIPLKDLKESNPVECADYAKARNLIHDPAFSWWVPHTLRKRDVIVSAVKARIRKVTHKYGVKLPRSSKHALELDDKNNNDLWAKSMAKEMNNVGIAFEILDLTNKVPPEWSKMSGHLVFDIKMTGDRKSRWVLDGHLTADPEFISTYPGASQETVFGLP